MTFPIAMAISNSTTLDQLQFVKATTTFEERALWDIIKGCTVTLFACVWVSVHPNMTAQKDRTVRIILVRLELMIWSLLVPEMVIFWALRQWIGAYALSKLHKVSFRNPPWPEFGWKMIHGYFAQMGGFVIEGKRGDLKVLHPRQLDLLHRAKQINFPVVTPSDLSDRSKGDAFSKVLVLGQTSWFIAQCIARHVAELSITQLEISTLSFCALNGVMYFLWWEKPLDARVPVQVRICDTVDSISVIDMDWAMNGDLLPAHQHLDTLSFNGLRDDVASRASRETKLSGSGEYADATFSHTATRQESLNRLISCTDYKVMNSREESALARVILFPYRRLQEMRGSVAYMTNNDEFTVRMPTYYAYPQTQNVINPDTLMIIFHIIGLLISSGFGCIHIAAWHTAFPTSAEMRLWRAATLTIIGAPLVYGIPMIMAVFLYPSVRKTGFIPRPKIPCHLAALIKVYQIVWMFIYILPAIYIIARLILLVEAVISLRLLPSSAFLTISWTKYVPHI